MKFTEHEQGVQHAAVLNVSTAEVADFRKYKWQALFASIDPASLAIFRISFGLILFWEVIRYFSNDWIARYWIRPAFHFTYWPFSFLEPLPGNGMYVLFGLLGLLALFIMIGLFYRVAAVLFFFGFTYSFLLEQTRYLNHFYLIILLSFILIFIPANRAIAIDTVLFRKTRSETIPAWPVWLLRFTIGLPYFFGGIAKINSDWLQGEPLRHWLANRSDFPVIGQFFTEDWMVYFIGYGGLLLDLLVIPFLLIKHTRAWAFVLVVVFHLLNAKLFSIGIFPWFMITATTIYFSPSWPRKIIPGLKKKLPLSPEVQSWTVSERLTKKQQFVLKALFIWVVIHTALPIRHFFIPGNVHWTEEGHKYAWHMKLRSKGGKAIFVVKDKLTGQVERVNTRKYLTHWQEAKMAGWPNLIWQFSVIIKNDYKKQGRDVTVHGYVTASLNGRPHQQLINSNIDLSTASRPVFGPCPWIVPLQTPLDRRSQTNIGEVEE